MAAIAYEPECELRDYERDEAEAEMSADRHAMDAFRYILSVQEKSQRAIDLTGVIIGKNAGMFTVW